jgi:hypothetical protein
MPIGFAHAPAIRRPFLTKGTQTLLTALIMLVAAQAANPAPQTTNVVQTTLTEPDVPSMGPRDIKAFNQTVPANHPYHIRCMSDPEIGSLVKRITVCKTNQQWSKADQIGNDDARDIGDKMASKFSNSN